MALALGRCGELGYLNDERLARRFVSLRAGSRGWGSRRLEVELRRRGVDDRLAQEAARLEPELAAQALETALRRVEARARPGWWRLHERRARMVSSLFGRGFDPDEARDAVARLAALRAREDEE